MITGGISLRYDLVVWFFPISALGRCRSNRWNHSLALRCLSLGSPPRSTILWRHYRATGTVRAILLPVSLYPRISVSLYPRIPNFSPVLSVNINVWKTMWILWKTRRRTHLADSFLLLWTRRGQSLFFHLSRFLSNRRDLRTDFQKTAKPPLLSASKFDKLKDTVHFIVGGDYGKGKKTGLRQ